MVLTEPDVKNSGPNPNFLSSVTRSARSSEDDRAGNYKPEKVIINIKDEFEIEDEFIEKVIKYKSLGKIQKIILPDLVIPKI